MTHSGLEDARPAGYLRRVAGSDLGRAYKGLVVDELAIAPGSTVLELGCGTGADLARLAEAAGTSGRVIGIDHDEDAVAAAAGVAADRPQVELRVGDVHRLDLPDAAVDRIHTDRVLQHVADPSAVVKEVARVLRPQGLAAFAEPDWDTLVVDVPRVETAAAYRRFVLERVVRNARIGRELPALCEKAGLRVLRVLPVTAVFREVSDADQVLGFSRVTRRAVAAGYLAPEEAEAWLDHLTSAAFFTSATLFVTLAESPA